MKTNFSQNKINGEVLLVSPADLSSYGGNVLSLIGIANAIEIRYGKKPFLLNITKKNNIIANNKISQSFKKILHAQRIGFLRAVIQSSHYNSGLFRSYVSTLNDSDLTILVEADIIIACHLMTAATLDRFPTKAKERICFLEVLESNIWDGLKSGWKIKTILRRLISTKKIYSDEIVAAKYFTRVISYSDTEKLPITPLVEYHPFPYITKDFPSELKSSIFTVAQDLSSTKEHITIGFIGNINWEPNFASLNKLLNFSMKNPCVRVIVAGKGTSALSPNVISVNVHVLGEIDDVSNFYNNIDLVWCDVETNGGVRVKIVEALCMGRLPICSIKSMEGIPEVFKRFFIEPAAIINSHERIRVLINDLLASRSQIIFTFSSKNLSNHI